MEKSSRFDYSACGITSFSKFQNFQPLDRTNNDVFNYYQSIKRFSVLTEKEEINLFKKIKKNDYNARQVFILHNLKLVVSIVKRLFQMNKITMEAINAGNLGLIKAVDMFDYTLNFRFSTYATVCIIDEIHNYIQENTSLIYIPRHLRIKRKKLKDFDNNFYNAHNRIPTFEEEHKALKGKLNKDEIYLIKMYERRDYSLNAKVTEDNHEAIDVIESKGVEDEVYSTLKCAENVSFIYKTFENLTDIEIKFILFYYGFLDRVYTVHEMALLFGKKEKDLYKIHTKALNKIKKYNPELENLIH